MLEALIASTLSCSVTLAMQDVIDAARTLDKVMGLNIAVCEPFYQAIIRRLWAEESAPPS